MDYNDMLDSIELYVRENVDKKIGMPIMDLMNSKWVTRLMFHFCRHRTLRFGEMLRLIPSISKTALSSSLKEMEARGLIVRYQFNEIPPHTEYSVTEAGLEYMNLVYSMIQWEKKYIRIGSE